MERLKNTLDAVMRSITAHKTTHAATAPEQWLKKALTKKELQHIKVRYFSKGILGLSVDSSAWLYILSLKKQEIVERLMQESPALKNITLRIGEI